MPPFRRVDAQRAGPTALGILVPPGERTVVVVRPRSLRWDLLPARWSGDRATSPEFRPFTRDEAARIAKRFLLALEHAAQVGVCPLESFGNDAARQIWVRTEELVWVLCRRTPGQAYEPIVFATEADVDAAGAKLEPILFPATDAEQEVYFNTQQFAS